MKEVNVRKFSFVCPWSPLHAVRVGFVRWQKTIRQLWLCEIGIECLTQGTVGVRLAAGNGVLESDHSNAF